MSFLNQRSAILAALMFAPSLPALAAEPSAKELTSAEEAAALEAVKDDAQIARVIDVANDLIIRNAEYAQKHAVSTPVLDYANALIVEHERFAREFDKIERRAKLSPKESTESLQLRLMGYGHLARLYLTMPAKFDETFAKQSKQLEQKIVDLLDGTLIPGAQNLLVKDYLTSMRGDINKFVQEANTLISVSRPALDWNDQGDEP